MDAGSAQFADLSSESRLASLEVRAEDGRRGRPRRPRARHGRPGSRRAGAGPDRSRSRGRAHDRRRQRRRARVPPRPRRRCVEGRREPPHSGVRRRSAGAARRRRDRIAPGDRGDPERPPPRRADRVPARPAALVLGLPRARGGVSAAARRCRRDRAHVPRAPDRGRGALPLGLRAQPRHRPRARPRDRLLALHRLALARGGGAPRARARGARRDDAHGRPHGLLQRAHRRRVDGLPARLPAAVPLLDGARRSPRRALGRHRRARAAAGVPLLARPADRRARATAAAAAAVGRALGAPRRLGDAAAGTGRGPLRLRARRARAPGARRPLRRRRRDDAARLGERAPGRRGARSRRRPRPLRADHRDHRRLASQRR